MSRAFVIFSLLSFAAEPRAQTPDDPPVAAPADFSHVVGQFRLASLAALTEVAVEAPITLKVQIIGQASPGYQPERKNLRLFPDDIESSFYVEAAADQDRLLPEKNLWEFVYRIRPKSDKVKTIPGLHLVYYAPGRKKFQTTFADEIPITVKPQAETVPKIENLQVKPLPDRFYKLYPAEEVLRDQNPLRVTPLAAAILFALPPLLCMGWYTIWTWRHPSAKQRLELRRSRAARFALGYLEKQQPDPVRAVAALTEYLRQRFDFPATEPTPKEIERHLRRLGAAKATYRSWASFFQTCDRLCFAPTPPAERPNLSADAVRLIHELEADPCALR